MIDSLRNRIAPKQEGVSEEETTQEQAGPKPASRIRLDQAGIEESIGSISRELADRLADYGFRGRIEGDISASMWIKEMVRDFSGRLSGILTQYNPKLGRAFGLIERQYRRKPAMTYYHKMNELAHEAMAMVHMVGKTSRPVSHDSGAGLFLSGSAGELEPKPE